MINHVLATRYECEIVYIIYWTFAKAAWFTYLQLRYLKLRTPALLNELA